jgi:hypothetical protein
MSNALKRSQKRRDRTPKAAPDGGELGVFAASTGELLRTFLTALARGKTPPCHAADNRHTLALMLAAYDSEAKRMPIVMT